MTQHQDQPDSREEVVGAKFKRRQLVRHVKTGGLYRIVHTPATCRLEAMNEPAYAYRLAFDGRGHESNRPPLWVRGQAEMEDGRFTTTPTDLGLDKLGEGNGSERCNGTASDAPSVRPDTGDA